MEPFTLITADGPLVAAAIHDGHAADPDTEARFLLDRAGRLREEDPFTAELAEVAPTRLVGRRSRFEVDLNRPPEKAVYRTPDDAWGLDVWKDELPEAVVQRSMQLYADFYAAAEQVLADKIAAFGAVVVYDLHTYNHRRDGPDGAAADPEANPEVNVGTGTVDRERWGALIDGFMADLEAGARAAGRPSLDVRENVKFKGGQFATWAHERFGSDACVLAVEFKKTFMDEWSGQPDRAHLAQLKAALAHTVPGTLRAFDAVIVQS